MTGKTVLITGAARRVGAGIARHLHSKGMNIVMHYHTSEQDALRLVGALNRERANSATLVQADLLNAEAFTTLAATALEFTGRLDVLINNASQFYPNRMGETTTAQWRELVGTNMQAPFFLAQACLTPLRANRGCIINITDVHGVRPLKDYSIYSAAKAGLLMLTQTMARELGPEIRVNAISPGPIIWPENMPEETKQAIIEKTVLKRAGGPEDIAKAAWFLIEEAGYMTGQVLNVDGGASLC